MDYTSAETAHHPTRWKRGRRDETAFINTAKNGHQNLGTTCRITGNAKEQLAFVRSRAAGLELARPKPKKPKRNPEYYAATLRLCENRGAITPEQSEILVNDIPELGAVARAAIAKMLAVKFGFDPAEAKRLAALKPRNIPATERATVFNTTYEEHRRLRLNRIGCCEVDAATRRRMTRERENEKRRRSGARTQEYQRRTERRRAAKLSSVTERLVDGDSTIKSLEAVIVTMVVTESKDKTRWIRPRIMESDKSCPKIVRIDLKKRRPPPETIPKDRLDSIPFQERVGLMMQHCGLGRLEAEAEARKWLRN